MRLASFLLVLALAWSPQASAQTAWESITSKEGQFTVDMPAKPSIQSAKSRTGPGGTVKLVTIGCETAGGIYIAKKLEFPTAIVKGTEDKELDEERNDLAKEWNGKVISEKKVRAEGKVGRDFTIRGEPAKGVGLLTIRVREYLSDKSMYVVLVVSAPNRELPADAGRFLGSLAIGAGKARASGKPEPEPTGTELAAWGLAIDPSKDSKFVPEEKSLTVQVPGTLHDLNPDSGVLSAPRVMKTVEGDFSITVKVSGDFNPGAKATSGPRGLPYNGAGILIWSDSDNFIRLERGAILRAGKVNTTVAFEEREGGYRGAVHNEVFPGGTCYLRVVRKGSRIMGGISLDGKTWKLVKPIDTVWPAKLKVGLIAINSSSDPFIVKFDEYSQALEK
jgi:regulation of enolase protein 1 (concanavalin A-like superfamily)